MIRHHSDTVAGRASWTPLDAQLPHVSWLAAADFAIQQDSREMVRVAAADELAPFRLTEAEITDLVAFLHALTGDTALERPLGRPDTVPSGLPVD
jgi:cytochrome c peroxidase